MMFRFSRVNLKLRRYNSSSTTSSAQYIRPRPKFYSLLKTPTTKSLILALITTSIMVDLLKARRETEQLQKSYSTKFEILRGVIEKLKNGEPVDLAKELNLANTFTRLKYGLMVDVEFDEQLEDFLKMANEDEIEEIGVIKSGANNATQAGTEEIPQIGAKNFDQSDYGQPEGEISVYTNGSTVGNILKTKDVDIKNENVQGKLQGNFL